MILNCALIRFVPYLETGEMVNIGVVANAPAVRFFDFRIERENHDRVMNFFPEIKRNPETYRSGLDTVTEVLIRTQILNRGLKDYVDTEQFKRLIRPRNGIFRYSPIRTILTEDPETELDRLFANYVGRYNEASGCPA